MREKKWKNSAKPGLKAGLCGLLMLAGLAGQAWADQNVTTNLDSGAGSLRQAVADGANSEKIVFAPGLAITLGGAIVSNHNIGAMEGNNSTISGDNSFRLLWTQDGGTVWNVGLISDLTMEKGAALGGVFDPGGALRTANIAGLSNATFRDNMAQYNGGAIYSANNITSITGSLFERNIAGANSTMGDGGAIYIWNDLTSISGSTFRDNQAAGSGGALYLRGLGGAATSTPSITTTGFHRNQAGSLGGAIASWLSISGITNSQFTYNSTTVSGTASGNGAVGGGALYMGMPMTGNISGCSFDYNTSADYGGAMYFYNGINAGIINSEITHNHSVGKGGAIFINMAGNDAGAAANLTLSTTGNNATSFYNNVDNSGPNDIHFGISEDYAYQAQYDATVTVSNAAGGWVELHGGIRADINNGKSFTLNHNSGAFNWGGVNVLDAAGGSTVNLNSGWTNFHKGFYLDNDMVNSSANVVLNLNSGQAYYMVDPTGNPTADDLITFNNTDMNIRNNSRLLPYAGLEFGKNTRVVLEPGSSIAFAPPGGGDVPSLHFNLAGRNDPASPFITLQSGAYLDIADGTPLYAHWRGSGQPATNRYFLIKGDLSTSDGATANGGFVATNTATVTFTLDQSTPEEMWLVGEFKPLPPGPGPDPVPSFLNGVSPNGQRVYSGFSDMLNNHRTEFMWQMENYYTTETIQTELNRTLSYMSAEGAVSQGQLAQTMHNAAAMTALGHAFKNSGPVAEQSFVPMNFRSGFSNAGNPLAITSAAYAMDNLDFINAPAEPIKAGYSIISSYQPAQESTRGLISSEAVPGYASYANNADSPYGVKLWGGYLGNFARNSGKDGYAGYDANHNGFVVGGSYDINDMWTVGAYVGYTKGKTEYDDINADIDTDAVHAGILARLSIDNFKLTGDFIYSHSNNDSERTVPLTMGSQTMKGSFDQNIFGFGLEAAYDWTPEKAAIITPYLAGRYSHLSQDGYSESGNLALQVGDVNANSFTTSLGVRVARDFMPSENVIVTPKINLGWVHQWGDTDFSTDSNFVGSPVIFMTRSLEQDRDGALLGASVDVLFKQGNNWDLGLKAAYGADIRSNSTDHSVFGAIEIKF